MNELSMFPPTMFNIQNRNSVSTSHEARNKIKKSFLTLALIIILQNQTFFVDILYIVSQFSTRFKSIRI